MFFLVIVRSTKVVNPHTNKIILSRYVIFNESLFLAPSPTNPTSLDSPFTFRPFPKIPQFPSIDNQEMTSPSNTTLPHHDLPPPLVNPPLQAPPPFDITPVHSLPSSANPHVPTVASTLTQVPSTLPMVILSISPPPLMDASPTTVPNPQSDPTHPLRTHSMVTHSQDDTWSPQVVLSTHHPIPVALLVSSTHLPSKLTCFTQGNNYLNWHQAMHDKFNSLLKNKNWSLVPQSPSMNFVGYKWVYKVKQRSDGLERYKARLVAKGFHQQFGRENGDTFSPIV